MEEINVEQIMEDIRKEIKEKNMEDVPLKFVDVSVTQLGVILPDKIDPFNLKRDIIILNEICGIASTVEVKSKNIVKYVIKKIVSKVVLLIVWPTIVAQERFNAGMTNILNQMVVLVDENQKLRGEVNDLKKRMEALEKNMEK